MIYVMIQNMHDICAYQQHFLMKKELKIVKAMKRLYSGGAGNQHGCREMLVGRRMNDRVLSCGQFVNNNGIRINIIGYIDY